MTIVKTAKFIASHPLGGASAARRLTKFLMWQIAVRLFNGKFVFDWVEDSKLLVGRGETGLTGNYYVGLMELQEMGFLLHYLRDTDVFVDVGANAGVFAVLASKVVGAKSHCFEPILETFSRLKRQLALNEIGDLSVAHNCGVGSQAGELVFTNDKDTTNHVVDNPANNTNTIQVVTLNETLPQREGYVFKIDVEGFEAEVLEGASALFEAKCVDALIIELCGSSENYGASDEVIDKSLRNYGFTAVSYDPLERELIQIDAYNLEAQNTIYVRDFASASTRIKHSKRYEVKSAFGVFI